MKNKLLSIFLIGGIIASMMLMGCEKDENEDEENNPFEGSSGNFTDSRDSKTYNWVKLGDQIWMAENLAYKPSSGNYWAFDDNVSNVSKYGYLYDWATAQNVAPAGWHMPTVEEWDELEDYLYNNGYRYEGGSITPQEIGKSMATKYDWDNSSNMGDVGNTDFPEYRNKSGFSALPAGITQVSVGNRIYFGKGIFCQFWTETSDSNYPDKKAHTRRLKYDRQYLDSDYIEKEKGISARYVKD